MITGPQLISDLGWLSVNVSREKTNEASPKPKQAMLFHKKDRDTPYRYYKNCTQFSYLESRRVGGLCDMVATAIEITRRTFLRHVDHESLKDLAASLGYANHPRQGLTLAGDYAVSYHRGKLYGQRVYFLQHSAIEYIFR